MIFQLVTSTTTSLIRPCRVHTTRKKFENGTITSHFGFVFEENLISARKSHNCHDTIVYKKLRFQVVFPPQENKKVTFSNPQV